MDEDHSALTEITQALAVRLINTYHHLNAAEKAKAEEKIIYGLYFLGKRFGSLSDTPGKISLPVKHHDIAGLIGLTRETASQELKKLKDAGYVHYDKYSFVIDQRKLEARL